MAPDRSLSALIPQAAALARDAREPRLAEFLPLFFAGATPDDFAGAEPQDLAALARGRLDFFMERKPGRPKLALAATPAGLTLDIVNDDMPFLVDSTLGLLNELGLDLRLFLHPVLGVRRDPAGHLEEIAPKTKAGSRFARESVIHAEMAPLPDAGLVQALEAALLNALSDVRKAVLDWPAMQARAKAAIRSYQANPPPLAIEAFTESIAFLNWLIDNHFTFLGSRDYAFEGTGAKGNLVAVPDTGLGLLRDPAVDILKRGEDQVTLTPEIRSFFMEPNALIITKSDLRSTVHRRAPMDYVGVKLFDGGGELAGELRLVGLFTSSAYTHNPNDIPLVRRKLKAVIQASGLDPSSHSGKALINVLETYPRDELFQIDEDALAAIAMGILRLEERPRTRLFVRRDRFDRFVSAFVFIPRDRFNSDVRSRIGELLAQAFDGRVASFEPYFGENSLVRVHYILQRAGGAEARPDLEALEASVVEAARSWEDRLDAAFAAAKLERAVSSHWREAFPAGYRAQAGLDLALTDIARLEALRGSDAIAAEFRRAPGEAAAQARLRLYHVGAAIPLSRRVPILENMGFRTISETTHALTPQGSQAVIHDILLDAASGRAIDVAANRDALEQAFMAVWTGAAENDALNALTLEAALSWRDVALLRAFGRFLRQAAATFTPDYMAQVLVKHSGIAGCLVRAFHARFDPERRDEALARRLLSEAVQALDKVHSLDEDRILRRAADLVGAILRTNVFQAGATGEPPLTIAFKIASRTIEDLPEPKPFAEIFVYGSDVEGVHLRAGAVARGGLRWSDRPEDFRTEVLGLAKAQNVKNAVIVPVGAKGGFVPKRLPQGGPREAIQAEGIRAYTLFVSSLLDLTDNLDEGRVVPPARTIRLDGDDPYLVVAADKGTAAFSDLANGISEAHDFWLGDAFASGGSAGYDHKKMGITARGAWEAIKRHFREMDIDIQETPFTVIGVGDMSGDVFGNAMLLSPRIRLVAAFDHRDIFIDPDPDPRTSFAERQRLFALPRSSWQDYDKALIAKGGGVFARSLKAIPLSPEMRSLAGLGRDAATPYELMNGLLKAPVDLLYFGGIGTYVKAAGESHAEAGDRANDAVRVDAGDLKAKVIGEGANLAVTQKGRIAFALEGGRINSDAVDNSAGVNSSDIEVNLKIALRAAEGSGRLAREARNALLGEMTDEVAGLVLDNNYLQTLCLSLAQGQGTEENGYAMQLMDLLEERGALDRKLEQLPGNAAVIERDAKGGGLTRPELAVLMAYAKLWLKQELIDSQVPDEPYFASELQNYFPRPMRARFQPEIASHRLRREIIATRLANSMINRGGPSFVSRLMEETNRTAGDVALAFAVARDSFAFPDLNGLVDRLDARVPIAVQMPLYLDLQKFVRWATIWFLRYETLSGGLAEPVARYAQGIAAIASSLGEVLPEAARSAVTARRRDLEAAGVAPEAAAKLSIQRDLQRAPDAVRIAAHAKLDLIAVARALYASSEALGIERLAAEAGRLRARDFIERRAINRLTGQLFQTHRAVVARVIDEHKAKDAWALWRAANAPALRRAQATIESLLAEKSFDLARLAVAHGALADLALQ